MDNSGAVYLSEFMNGAAPPVKKQWTHQERDRAQRASDLINEAISDFRADWDILKTHWIAIRLSDGGSDMVIYESKKEAVKHQFHEQQCAYIAFRNLINGASPREMLRFLRFVEEAYDAGFRLPDPDAEDGGPDLAPTAEVMDKITGRRRARR